MKRRGFLVAVSIGIAGCYRNAISGSSSPSPEQQIVDRAALAIQRMRESGRFALLEDYLAHAEGVMIFPRVIKASLIFGGEGGNGVFVARREDGNMSSPAFYTLGAGSAGFQLGYQEATVILFFMSEAAVLSAIGHGLTLGTDTSVAAGTLGESGSDAASNTASDIHQLVDVGGLFAGVSLDGTVVGARERFNEAYYGAGATTHAILIGSRFDSPGAESLREALRPQPTRATPAP